MRNEVLRAVAAIVMVIVLIIVSVKYGQASKVDNCTILNSKSISIMIDEYNNSTDSSQRIYLINKAKSISTRLLAIYTYNDSCRESVKKQVSLLSSFYDNVDNFNKING